MRVDQFDFDLPEDRIALRPVSPRDSAKLLVVHPGLAPQDRVFSQLPELLRAGDALVFNDTKVLPVQLEGVRLRGEKSAKIGVTLVAREGPDRWRAFIRGAKKVRIGDSLSFRSNADIDRLNLTANAIGKSEDGACLLAFDRSGSALDEAIEAAGAMPLPPYIAAKRAADERDRDDYQTVFAREEGAVAAPTAGLHFTSGLFDKLAAKGIETHFVTLHVGPGTFLPVKSDLVRDHVMHAEIGRVTSDTAQALNRVRSGGGRIVCVGTTSLRLLESAADPRGTIHEWSGPTDIFITPGYRFRAADLLITNFHLPRSTLFMLVSAFSGLSVMQSAYRHAIDGGYRFYSYGDACLLFRTNGK